ncbi:MAG: ribbon-helix-helix domain-containing protein [Rhodospirillales bacterium]|nr:ribbon-helix-helix domain-containing protein [Rhodospirillales bacterium]MCB9995472.1 ribbon-helix-helix domain-containing protein [Rhodospirillales bacterium]
MKKRSIKIQGHATSISLEEEFWTELKEIAATQKRPVSHLVAEIDKKRGRKNLSSALRLYVLAALKQRSA